MKRKYEVIVKTDLVDLPKDHELSAALILAYHFKTDVIFLRPETKKTPDIDVNGTKLYCINRVFSYCKKVAISEAQKMCKILN